MQNIIQKYLSYRQALIDQYIRGDMTKREYLNKNLDAVMALNIKPFNKIDSVEKGLFNYQYYNALAKDARAATGRHGEDVSFFYREKDRAALSILRLLDYENVSAYYIKVRSKFLNGKIYEIVINDYNAIMHSKNGSMLESLKRAGVFKEGAHRSLVEGYINQRY